MNQAPGAWKTVLKQAEEEHFNKPEVQMFIGSHLQVRADLAAEQVLLKACITFVDTR